MIVAVLALLCSQAYTAETKSVKGKDTIASVKTKDKSKSSAVKSNDVKTSKTVSSGKKTSDSVKKNNKDKSKETGTKTKTIEKGTSVKDDKPASGKVTTKSVKGKSGVAVKNGSGTKKNTSEKPETGSSSVKKTKKDKVADKSQSTKVQSGSSAKKVKDQVSTKNNSGKNTKGTVKGNQSKVVQPKSTTVKPGGSATKDTAATKKNSSKVEIGINKNQEIKGTREIKVKPGPVPKVKNKTTGVVKDSTKKSSSGSNGKTGKQTDPKIKKDRIQTEDNKKTVEQAFEQPDKEESRPVEIKIEGKQKQKKIDVRVQEQPPVGKDGKKTGGDKKATVEDREAGTEADSLAGKEEDFVVPKEEKSSRGKKKSTFETVSVDTLSAGVIYRKFKIGNGKDKVLIHMVEADLNNPENYVALFKGRENSSELEKLHDMVRRYNESSGDNVLTAVNGSFWKAFYNYPMGPTVIDGEVVELKPYRSWPSAFVDENNRVFIDNIKLNGTLSIHGKKTALAAVNRREDSTGVVLYNRYTGDTIPYISKKMVSRAFEDALLDSAYKDITDSEFDTTSFKLNLLKMERDSSIELNMKKILVHYLDKPAINRDIRCVVAGVVDSGPVSVPRDGFVLTTGFGSNLPELREGDYITLRYSTDKHTKTVFTNAVTGTPWMMRSGKSTFEGPQKRNRSRFKWEELPRTAIGTNRTHDKVYLISASPTYKYAGIKGCTLENFAFAMKKLKIWDAVNLDGGGSSVMLVRNRNVLSCPECSRRLSIGVGIVVKNNISEK